MESELGKRGLPKRLPQYGSVAVWLCTLIVSVHMTHTVMPHSFVVRLEINGGSFVKRMVLFALSALLIILSACSPEEDLSPNFAEEDWHYWSMDKAEPGYVQGVIQYEGEDLDVQARVRDDKVFLQGDIMMGRRSEIGNQAAIISSRFWTNSTVPYTIRDDVPSGTRDAIRDAVNFYNTRTNVRWVERTTQRDFVEFFPGSGCWSYVGRNGGKQQISLGFRLRLQLNCPARNGARYRVSPRAVSHGP